MPVHPLWAVGQLAEVTRERGFPGWVGRLLTPEEVRRIARTGSPVIRTWLDREHERAGWSRWRPPSVGDCRSGPGTGRGPERLVEAAAHSHTAAQAMALLAEHLPNDRERVITAALARDESWAIQPAVMNYLHARRQDLLTPFLGQRAIKGWFSTGRVRYVLPLASGFHRWTDSQQETFAATLAELAKPPARAADAQVTWDVLHAVRRLPALPAVGAGPLIALARDERPAVQETAVLTPWAGSTPGRASRSWSMLLGDARAARSRVYALRQALDDLPPARVLAVMRAVPLGKVTVAKEAVRLAGEFGGPAALGWFAELDRRDLHRDVRGALLRASWDHLERPEAWSILDSSAGSPDPGVVIGLARIQVDRASAAARERVADLLGRLLGHPEPTVRVAVLDRLATQPVPDPRRTLLAATLGKLASAVPDERASGLQAAVAGAADPDSPAFAAAFARLLPDRRRLAEASAGFAQATRFLGPRLLEVRSAVLAAVEADPASGAVADRFGGRPVRRGAVRPVGAGWPAPPVGTPGRRPRR